MLSKFISRVKETLKGGEIMMAMMFAINISRNKFKFSRVPAVLKPAVKEQLEMMDLDEKVLADLLAK